MNFARRVFFVAGIYGIVALLPQYFMEPPALTRPEYFYGFIGVALAWQFLFLLIARDPGRYRPAMWPAMFEKVSFGIAAIVLFVQGRLAAPIFAAGLIDLLLAAFFFIAWKVTPEER